MPLFRTIAILIFAITHPFSLNGQTYMIKSVNVIEVESGKIKPNQEILIENGRIKMIGVGLIVDDLTIDSFFDGTNKFLIPGLFDMHAHLGPESWLKMYLHYGITGVRIMAGNDKLLELRDSLSLVMQPNPSLYISSCLIDGNPPLWGDQQIGPVVESNTDINPILDDLLKKGYKELKVYNRLPSDQYEKILQYAEKNNLRVSGHIPYNLGNNSFPDPRHHSVEHMDGFVQYAKQNSFLWDSIGVEELQRTSLYNDLVIEDFEEISNRIKSNGIWICPTLSLYGNIGNDLIRELIAQNEFKEELAGIFGFWRTLERLKGEFNLKYTVHSSILSAYFKDFSERILAGTDSPNPYNPPGQALHFELIHLAEAGFSNAQILKIATLNAASYLNLESELGSIEEGKIADMVLLNQNPLEKIQATQDIYQVFKNGKPVLNN
ncbi:amidohydrolase family protein [Shivajiella indica]|uniref:Amidohydrolase family protein n=1 Tax=Shivajiella indica TaxID=872115 RepID=A0ABW5B674_9BACT